MDDEELSRSLVMNTVYHKSKMGQAKAIRDAFSIYCSDVAPWAVELSRKAKREFLIGRHPFMLSDSYDDQRDKAAAVLMSAVIPMDMSKLSKRLSIAERLMGGSPYNFIIGGYKIRDFKKGRGLGCSSETLQKWCAVLHEAYLWTEPTEGNVKDFIRVLKESMSEYEFDVSYNMRDSFNEAVFWLCESVFRINGADIPIPITKAVWDFIRAYMPHHFIIGIEDCVRLFGFDYPAMVWYAAQGRRWLYKTNYDGIYMMEHNLAAKMKRATPMTSYERWRFRKTVLSKVSLDRKQ